VSLNAPPAYRRILLKLSGEAFSSNESSVDFTTTAAMAEEIAAVAREGFR